MKLRNRNITIGALTVGVLAVAAFFGAQAIAQSAGKFYVIVQPNQRFLRDTAFGQQVVETQFNVTLTSPSVTLNCAGKRNIYLTSSANQTGGLLTGGEDGQIVDIVMAGSHTLRFDSATSLPLNANLTLTANDTAEFVCEAGSHGTLWHRRSSAVNH